MPRIEPAGSGGRRSEPAGSGGRRSEPAGSGGRGSDATVTVRVRPRASRTAVGGAYAGASGPALIVAVREPAVDGRATKAVLEAVASALELRRSQVLLRTGERSRDKLLTIVDPPADLAARLAALLGDAAGDGGTRA